MVFTMHVIKALGLTLVLVGVVPKFITSVGAGMEANTTLGLAYYGCGVVLFALLWCGMLLDSIDQTTKRLRAERLNVEEPAA